MIKKLFYDENMDSYFSESDVWDCDTLILPDGHLCTYDGRNGVCAKSGSLFYKKGNSIIKSILQKNNDRL